MTAEERSEAARRRAAATRERLGADAFQRFGRKAAAARWGKPEIERRQLSEATVKAYERRYRFYRDALIAAGRMPPEDEESVPGRLDTKDRHSDQQWAADSRGSERRMSFGPRTRRGCRAANASLTPEQVVRIRKLTKQDWTARQIKAALELTCSEQTVRRVMIDETYRETGG